MWHWLDQCVQAEVTHTHTHIIQCDEHPFKFQSFADQKAKDGDKTASVQPSFGFKQACLKDVPLPSAVRHLLERHWQHCRRGERRAHRYSEFLVTHMLSADDLCLMSNNPNHMQTMLNKLQAYARRRSLTVNTQKSEVMCFNSYTNNMPPLFYDGAQLLQISGHDLWQTCQFECCFWCSASSIHSWYFPHRTVHMGTWPY